MADDLKRATTSRDLLWLCLGIGLFYFGTIWYRPFASPDEGRYAEIPREMVATSDWITPRLNGVLYFEKPPLGYWLGALAIEVAGLHEATLRFWPAALGLVTCLVVYGTGRRLYGRTAGLAAAIILATSSLWFGMSQVLTLDMAVSSCASIGLCLFLLAVRESPGKLRFGWMLGVYVFLGLATLAKGLIGFLVPGAVMFLWTLLLNQWRKLIPLYLWIGVPLFLAITVPWHWLAAQATPAQANSAGFFSANRSGQGFLWYYIVNEHFLRYLTPGHKRGEPFWFFLAILPAGLFPWVTFLPQAVRHGLAGGWSRRRERREEWFFVIWILFFLLFFSFSQSKLVPYILPVYPALALLLGRFVAPVWEQTRPVRLRAAWIALGLLMIGMSVAAPIALTSREWNTSAARWPWLSGLVACLVIGAGASFGFGLRGDSRRGLFAPLLCAATLMALANPLGRQVMRPSAKAVCLELKPRLAADTPVFCLRDYYQDVPVYLNRLVGVADLNFDNPNFEQSFGLETEAHQHRYLSQAAFLELWSGARRIYAIAASSKLAAFSTRNPDWHPHVIFSDGHFVLLSNQPDV